MTLYMKVKVELPKPLTDANSSSLVLVNASTGKINTEESLETTARLYI